MSAFWLVFLGEKAHILHTWKEDPGIKALSTPTSLTPQTSQVLPKSFNPMDPRHFKKWPDGMPILKNIPILIMVYYNSYITG